MPVPVPLMSPSLRTPSRSHTRTASNNTSYVPTIVPGGGQQKLNIVTRVAIEGKAKKGQDGASIRMFLKLNIPVDLVTPGSTVALFQEENIKVLKSQVHPLDHNSAPYKFSSTVSPLLHSAARALNLPARLPHTFDSVLKQMRANGYASSIRTSRSEPNDLVPPVDTHYTGQVSVSGYNIAFVLPKEFLMRSGVDEESYMQTPSISRSRSEDEAPTRTPLSKGRLSIGERNQVQFMAAIDMWVPFLSKPPRSPFLLSIPTPRCLHNHIRLRIFPPHITSTSFASLSSMEEDSNTWDLTSDPHVTRCASRPSRTGSYTHFADDESSESAASAVHDSGVIQGTFPSAQRIRVRWARPPRNVNLPGEENALRRVGVENVKSEMVCIIQGKGSHPSKLEIEGVVMDVEYKGECKGIWFPGVATMLGLDISIISRNCDIWWAPGHTPQWEVSGSNGYTGFDNRTTFSQVAPSLESNGAPSEQTDLDLYDTARTRPNSASNASLLRAPLPSHHVEDYSFESSNTTLPSGASSVSSLPVFSESEKSPEPCSTIAIHLNMNDLQPQAKNLFNFRISGTIVVTPKAPLRANGGENDKMHGVEPVTLPRFTVLAADSESTSLSVRNEIDGASVEVFKPYGDIYTDPQARKTVLQRNGTTRCGEEGGRIALKFFDVLHSNGNAHTIGRPRTPSSNMIHRSNRLSARAKREGPLIITSVHAVVTAFTPGDGQFPDGYAVRLSLKTPIVSDSEWLEFGISTNANNGQSSKIKPRPKVVLICASIDGIPVKAEIVDASMTFKSGEPFGIPNGQEWLSWGKVYAAGSVGGNMVVDYLVKEEPTAIGKGKQKMPDFAEMNILLPTFFLPVARFEAKIDAMPGLNISSVRSEFDYARAFSEGYRLVLFSVKGYTRPQISLTIKRNPGTSNNALTRWSFIVTWTCLLAVFASLYRLSGETERLRKITDGYPGYIEAWSEIPTITTTTTTDNGSGIRPLFADTESSSSLVSSISVTRPTVTTTDVLSTETTTTLNYDHTISYTEYLVEGSSLAPKPPYSMLESYGLLPIAHIFASTWTDHQVAFRHALEKLTHSAHFFWNICRRLYHYPLDPP